MEFQPNDYRDLLGIEGLSDKLLEDHFTLYEAYVENANKLLKNFEEAENKGDLKSLNFAEGRRRFAWEYNGIKLHQLFFEGLSKKNTELELSNSLHSHIIEQFGSFENWKKEFSSICMMRGIGWAVLYYDQDNDKLFNVWINEHDKGHLVSAQPIIVVDLFEHAYMTDYSTKKQQYVDVVFKLIDWSKAEQRFKE